VTKYSCNKCSWWITTSDIIQCCAECGSSDVIVIFEGEENEKVDGRGTDTNNAGGDSGGNSCGDFVQPVSEDSLDAV
jgi:hypothetical protein